MHCLQDTVQQRTHGSTRADDTCVWPTAAATTAADWVRPANDEQRTTVAATAGANERAQTADDSTAATTVGESRPPAKPTWTRALSPGTVLMGLGKQSSLTFYLFLLNLTCTNIIPIM